MIRTLGLSVSLLFAITSACADGQQTAPSDNQERSWYPSKYGASDRLGAVNNLSPEKTAEAAKLITRGISFSLGMVTGRATPAYGPREYDVTVLQLSDGSGTPLGANLATGNDDIVDVWVGIGSQIDGLGHMGTNHLYYNGVPSADFVTPAGLTQFGTHTLPPIATRGVLLDMTKSFADPVPDGTAFNQAEIDAAAARAGVTLEAGDVVLFHTGKMKATANEAGLAPGIPGLGVEGAQYLADLGIVAVGADTWALEVIPFEDATRPFDVHIRLLAQNGVYILENMDTTALAEDGEGAFFFSLGVPRLEGTVQAIINPIALR